MSFPTKPFAALLIREQIDRCFLIVGVKTRSWTFSQVSSTWPRSFFGIRYNLSPLIARGVPNMRSISLSTNGGMDSSLHDRNPTRAASMIFAVRYTGSASASVAPHRGPARPSTISDVVTGARAREAGGLGILGFGDGAWGDCFQCHFGGLDCRA